MVIFTSIPNHMDKQMFVKSLSKEYKMPLNMIWCLIRDMDDEENSSLCWNGINPKMDLAGRNRR